MPHAAPTPSVPPPAPVPVTGPLAGLLSEQATLWEIFIALARIGMQFPIRFLPHTATLAQNYPRHWRAFLESNLAFLRVLLTVRFAPERITISQFRRLWRARQLIESLFGGPLPCFHSQSLTESLGARTPSSATSANSQTPSPNSPSPAPPGPRTSSSATPPASANPQPRTPSTPSINTPSVPQVPFCSLSPSRSRSRSDADSSASSRSHSRSQKRAPASLQSIIAMMESSTSTPQASSPHSVCRTPYSIMPPFIPDVATLHAALKADTLPANCAGVLLDKPADTLIKALKQVHALIHAFPQLSPSPSSSGNPQSSIHNSQSEAPSVHLVHPVHSASDIGHLTLDNSSSDNSFAPHSSAPP